MWRWPSGRWPEPMNSACIQGRPARPASSGCSSSAQSSSDRPTARRSRSAMALHRTVQRQRQHGGGLQQEQRRDVAGQPVDRRQPLPQEGPGRDRPAQGQCGQARRAPQRGPARRRRAPPSPARPAQPARCRPAAARTPGSATRTAASRCAARTSGSPTAGSSTSRSTRRSPWAHSAATSRAMRLRSAASGMRAARRGHVLPQVRHLAGGRDRAGHGRVADHELQRHLRPMFAADLRGPARQAVARQLLQQRAFAEGPVDDDADAALLRQRQQAAARPRGPAGCS